MLPKTSPWTMTSTVIAAYPARVASPLPWVGAWCGPGSCGPGLVAGRPLEDLPAERDRSQAGLGQHGHHVVVGDRVVVGRRIATRPPLAGEVLDVLERALALVDVGAAGRLDGLLQHEHEVVERPAQRGRGRVPGERLGRLHVID